MNEFARLSAGDGTLFLLRWRGRQEGPYTGSGIDARLAAHEIGLLHEVYHEGKWITLRDYLTLRTDALRAEAANRDQQDRQERTQTERQRQEHEAQHRAELLVEERRKNDLLAAGLARPAPANPPLAVPFAPPPTPHRGGLIFALGLVGLLICGPLCIAAWLMGNQDLRAMDDGRVDASGRSHTTSGRNFGILGTILWGIGIAIYLFAR